SRNPWCRGGGVASGYYVTRATLRFVRGCGKERGVPHSHVRHFEHCDCVPKITRKLSFQNPKQSGVLMTVRHRYRFASNTRLNSSPISSIARFPASIAPAIVTNP